MSDLDRAIEAIEEMNLEEAEEHARKSIEADPEEVHGYVILSGSLYYQGRIEEAGEVARAGLVIEPNMPGLLMFLAHAQVVAGDTDRALRSANEALQIDPTSTWAIILRSYVLEARGLLDEALKEARNAVDLHPDDNDCHRRLGDLYLWRDLATAEKWYRSALEIDPNDAISLNNLGTLFLAMKRPMQAREAHKAALLLDPTSGKARGAVYRSVHNELKAMPRSVMISFLVVLCLITAVGFVEAIIAELGYDMCKFSESPLYALLMGSAIAIAFLILVIGTAVTFILRSQRLKRTDPQLYEIYKQLKKDKKEGKLELGRQVGSRAHSPH